MFLIELLPHPSNILSCDKYSPEQESKKYKKKNSVWKDYFRVYCSFYEVIVLILKTNECENLILVCFRFEIVVSAIDKTIIPFFTTKCKFKF